MAKYYRGWRYAAFISGFVGLIGITLYPIAIAPMYDSDTKAFYKRVQEETRKNIRREDIQPGNMNVWTDPFGRKKSD